MYFKKIIWAGEKFRRIKRIIFGSFISSAILTPILSFANTTIPPNNTSGKIVNPISAQTLPGFIQTILTGVIKIGIPVIALAIIYSGFLFVKARGKPEEITKAKDALVYTLIGAAILLGAWAIALLITNTVTAL